MNEREAAEKQIAREMQRRTETSIFDARGGLRESEARSRTKDGDLYLGEYLHLAGIEWAPDPDGSDHCTWLSRLVEYMAKLPPGWGGIVGGPFDVHEQKVLHAVAMLYCTGKRDGSGRSGGLLNGVSKGGGVQGYEARSAKLADEFFRNGGGSGTYWGKPEVRDEVCGLIYKHNDPREILADKRLQVFQDALRYETVRLHPNTGEGMALLKERCKPELFKTGWAADRANLRGYMISRGGWR